MKGFGTFLTKPEINIVLVTYRDNFQKRASEEHGKFSDKYRELSAIIYLDDSDFATIDAKDGKLVKVTNSNSETGASIIVGVKKSQDGQKGIGFMPNSPWSNRLITIDADGMPSFKHTNVKIALIDSKEVSDISESQAELQAEL